METLWNLRGLAVIAILVGIGILYKRQSNAPGGLRWTFYVILFFAFIIAYVIISPPP